MRAYPEFANLDARLNGTQHVGKPSLTLLRFADDALPWLADCWLVEDVLPDRGLGVLFGAPGSRKTFTALDLALHVAAGTEWRGRPVEKRAVLYLSLEGGNAFRNRLAAWRQYHGRDVPLFFRCPEKLDLRSSDTDAERVIAAGHHIEGEAERVGLVVVDTLNRAMPGGNENGVEDIGAFIAICDSIARALGCFVLVIHHSGKDAAKGSRGHSSLLAACDTEMSLADGVLTITKQRDGHDGLRVGVDLAEIEIGTTPKGRAVTSCVAVEAEIRSRSWQPRGNARAVWEALIEYARDHGEPNPGGTGWPPAGSVKMVSEDVFRPFAQGRFADSNPRQTYRRAIDALRNNGKVALNGGFIWAIHGTEHAEH